MHANRPHGVFLLFALLVGGGLMSAQESNPLPALAKALQSGQIAIVDLTYTLDDRAPYWPEGKKQTPFRAKVGAVYERNGLFARELEIPEHFGTHLDAPLHFKSNGWDVAQIPLERFLQPAVVIDVAEAVKKDPEYRATLADVEKWEGLHGPMPRGCIVLFRTGWSTRWPSQAEYMKQEADGTLHFPTVAPEAVRYIMQQVRPAAIGIDSPGIDLGSDKTYELHHLTLGAGTFLLENVASLDPLPATGAFVICLPMKLGGGSGSPTRMIALVPQVPARGGAGR
jgi:kynurenine formamidase